MQLYLSGFLDLFRLLIKSIIIYNKNS